MKNCILFAAGLSDSGKLYIIDELLTALKINLPEADYYVGINSYSFEGTSEAFLSHINPVAMEKVSPELYVESDTSAFQLAMKLLKESKRKYDLFWFVHTKGGYHARDERRKLYIEKFIGRAWVIENMFREFPGLGIYGLQGVAKSAGGIKWSAYNKDHIIDICGNVSHDRFRYTHVNWSYIETFYAIRGDAVNHFLDITDDDFYNSKISDICYFETIIPWIPTRMGLFPYVDIKKCFRKKGNLNMITSKWIRENNLQCPEFDLLLTL